MTAVRSCTSQSIDLNAATFQNTSAGPLGQGLDAMSHGVISDHSGASPSRDSHSMNFYPDMEASLNPAYFLDPVGEMAAEADHAPEVDLTADAVHPLNLANLSSSSASSGEALSGSDSSQREHSLQIEMTAVAARGKEIAENTIVCLPFSDSYTPMELFNALKRNHSLLRKYFLNSVTLMGREGRYRLSDAALLLSCPFFSTAHNVTNVKFHVIRDPAFPVDGWLRKKKKKKSKKRKKKSTGIKKTSTASGEWIIDDVWEHRNLGGSKGYSFLTDWRGCKDTIWSDGICFYDPDGTVTEKLKKYLDTVPEVRSSSSFKEWYEATIAKLHEQAGVNEVDESSG